MKKLCLGILLSSAVGFSAPSSPPPRLADAFALLANEPSAASLEAFRTECLQKREFLPLDGHPETSARMKKLGKASGEWAIRGLVLARNCVDGASALSLRMYLGVEVLLERPKELVVALTEEKVAEKSVREIARSESDAFFAFECRDLKCRRERRKFYESKKAALAEVTEGSLSVRQALLAGIEEELKRK